MSVYSNSEVYTDSLIDKIKAGSYAAPLFRDDLANQAMDTLLRKSGGGTYAILIGDPGVGKTAVLELIASNIVTKNLCHFSFRELRN